MKKDLITKFLFVLILVVALGLRIYKLDTVPPSITWDEAAVGYNAWTIANFGRDEHGNLFPLVFRSFGEYKQPIHIYTTALFVKLFDLSEFSTRLSVTLFGILNVLLIFYLTRSLFNNSVGLLSSLFLAISPQNIHFSRFNHEANFALFFFMMGLLLFFYSIKKEKLFLPLSFLFFVLSLFSYNAAQDKSSNNVSIFGKYFFGGWNPFESPGSYGVLYVLSPSEYDGLMYRSNFDVKKIIYYPNSTTAFYLVSLK